MAEKNPPNESVFFPLLNDKRRGRRLRPFRFPAPEEIPLTRAFRKAPFFLRSAALFSLFSEATIFRQRRGADDHDLRIRLNVGLPLPFSRPFFFCAFSRGFYIGDFQGNVLPRLHVPRAEQKPTAPLAQRSRSVEKGDVHGEKGSETLEGGGICHGERIPARLLHRFGKFYRKEYTPKQERGKKEKGRHGEDDSPSAFPQSGKQAPRKKAQERRRKSNSDQKTQTADGGALFNFYSCALPFHLLLPALFYRGSFRTGAKGAARYLLSDLL